MKEGASLNLLIKPDPLLLQEMGKVPAKVFLSRYSGFRVNIKCFFIIFFFINYCDSNQFRNFSKDTDSITIGIELCKIPQISEHCP